MNLHHELSHRQHKEFVLALAKKIVQSKSLRDEFFELLINAESPIPQHAGWTLHHISDVDPEAVVPYLHVLLKHLDRPAHDAVKRGIVRALVPIDIPDDHIGHAADICFRFLENAKETIAVKVHSMSVLSNICQKIPELKEELAMQIEIQMPTGSAGFKSRGRKILKAIRG